MKTPLAYNDRFTNVLLLVNNIYFFHLYFLTFLLFIYCALYSSTGSCVDYGIGYHKGIVHQEYTSSWQKCGELCQGTSACYCWSWGIDDAECYLYNTDLGRETTNNMISGLYDCFTEC